MPRFFVPGEIEPGSIVVLDGQDARHVRRVLRLGPGDEIEMLDGTGREYRARIASANGERVAASVLAEGRQVCREPSVFITILQGLPKGDKMDEVVRKNTEIGASRIVPVITERSVARPDPSEAAKRVERWRRIAREASKQAGRQRVPEVFDIVGFQDSLCCVASEMRRMDHGVLFLMPWELEGSRGIRDVLREHRGVREVLCFIGPEGGFSHDEVRQAAQLGAITCGLGPRILRTETAGLVVCSLILYEAGEMGRVAQEGQEVRVLYSRVQGQPV
ncbi:MAG: 16S rRNA (uracil(1498)-N(3))-methyltransferase [Bacillota bacterium]